MIIIIITPKLLIDRPSYIHTLTIMI